MNDEEKAKPSKTKATQQAVFAYCDLLASQGFRGDFYKEIAEHFGSSVGSRNDYSATVQLPSYTTLDLNAEYRIHKDWSVQARIANVTNKNYETAYGYNQLGRAGYLTLKWAPK